MKNLWVICLTYLPRQPSHIVRVQSRCHQLDSRFAPL